MDEVSRRTDRRRGGVGWALVLLALAACHDSTTSTAAVASLIITPAAPNLEPGAKVQLHASPLDADGNALSGRIVSWTSSAAAVASVSSGGVVTGVTVGQATVTATCEGREATAAVAVVPHAVATITVQPSPMLVAAGGSFEITAVARDSRGARIDGKVLSFASSDHTIATVSSTGTVSGWLAGSATITASVDDVAGTALVTVVAPTSLTGQVVAADGGALGALQFEVRTGAGSGLQTFASALQGSGAFQLEAPLTFGAADSVDLIVDAVGPGRTYHPTMARVATSDAGLVASRPLLVPRTVSFSTQSYPNASLDVSVQDAFTRVCLDDSNANCDSFFPKRWLTIISMWRDSDLPIAVAFNRTASTSAVSADDSIAFWTVIHEMEGDLGRQLFRPVDLASLPAPSTNGMSMWAVLVSVDSTLLPTYGGFTNWLSYGSTIVAGKVRIAKNAWMGDRGLVTHELLHALGFSHTCAWSSVMGGYGCPVAGRATIGDAAAFNLAYEIERTMVAEAPTTALAATLMGEGLLELSNAPSIMAARTAGPVPFAASVRGPIMLNGRTMMLDGAP